MLTIFYAGCLGLSPAILAQFTLEMSVTACDDKKITKILYLGGSRSCCSARCCRA